MRRARWRMKRIYGCAVIVTYRCNGRCTMCQRWAHQMMERDEFAPELIERLPPVRFANITGGEPFLRGDIGEIIERLYTKAERIVVSTNGSNFKRMAECCTRHPDLGVRISVEGTQDTNRAIRGPLVPTEAVFCELEELKALGCADLGISMTISDANYTDALALFERAEALGVQMATGVPHNSFFFASSGAEIQRKEEVSRAIRDLADAMMASRNPKNWARAYFTRHLIEHVNGDPTPIPCGCGETFFALQPDGTILPCLGGEAPIILGNLNDQSFEEIWYSAEGKRKREHLRCCTRNCWMSGPVGSDMRDHALAPLLWIAKEKALR